MLKTRNKGNANVNADGVEKVKKKRRKQVTGGGAEGVTAAACVHVEK